MKKGFQKRKQEKSLEKRKIGKKKDSKNIEKKWIQNKENERRNKDEKDSKGKKEIQRKKSESIPDSFEQQIQFIKTSIDDTRDKKYWIETSVKSFIPLRFTVSNKHNFSLLPFFWVQRSWIRDVSDFPFVV